MTIRLTPNQLKRITAKAHPLVVKRSKALKNKIPAPHEKEIQRAVLKLLKDMGIEAWRTNSGMQVHEATENSKRRVIRSAPPGTPDIIGWLPGGRFLGIEIKRPGERPRPSQVERLQKINHDGGAGFWVTSVYGAEIILRALLDPSGKRHIVKIRDDAEQFFRDAF